MSLIVEARAYQPLNRNINVTRRIPRILEASARLALSQRSMKRNARVETALPIRECLRRPHRRDGCDYRHQ